MPIGLTTLGDLTCRIVGRLDRPEPPRAIVILCHGFGAGGGDLVPLAGELSRCHPEIAEQTWFVLPEAPLAVPDIPGARAWWPIDVAALQRAVELGEFRDLRQESPPELPAAREKLIHAIDALQSQTALPLSQFVLGGFSQGSMLATDVSLRLPEAVGGLVIYSGTLLVEPEWRQLAPSRQGLRVLQSHGTLDSLLPHEAALWLHDLLVEAGADVRFLSFEGGHTIPYEAQAATARLIAEVLDQQSSITGSD